MPEPVDQPPRPHGSLQPGAVPSIQGAGKSEQRLGDVIGRLLLNSAAWYLPGLVFCAQWIFAHTGAEPAPISLQTAAWLTMPVPFILLVGAYDGPCGASASMLGLLPFVVGLPAWLSYRLKWGKWVAPIILLAVSILHWLGYSVLIQTLSDLAHS